MENNENKKNIFPFSEDKYVKELLTYINKCNNSGHYANDKKQTHTFELIAQGPDMRGLHYCIGTMMSYLDRFGSKGGYNRKDLIKALHFGIFALYAYDNYGPKEDNKTDHDIIDGADNV